MDEQKLGPLAVYFYFWGHSQSLAPSDGTKKRVLSCQWLVLARRRALHQLINNPAAAKGRKRAQRSTRGGNGRFFRSRIRRGCRLDDQRVALMSTGIRHPANWSVRLIGIHLQLMTDKNRRLRETLERREMFG